jgi:hypothetical protein
MAMRAAAAFVWLIAFVDPAGACQPISPGSSVLDCRTPEQIEQARAGEVNAKAEQQRAAEAKAKIEQERATRGVEQKRRSLPQTAKGPVTDPAELVGCRVTLAKFSELKDGMSYYQARDALGCNGTLMSRSDVAGYATVMYGWDGAGFAANMNAMFQNGNLVSKAQFGLK